MNRHWAQVVINQPWERGERVRELTFAIARAMDIPAWELLTRSQGPRVREARNMLCLLAVDLLGWSLNELGELIDRDHSTVKLLRTTAQNLEETDDTFKTITASVRGAYAG